MQSVTDSAATAEPVRIRCKSANARKRMRHVGCTLRWTERQMLRKVSGTAPCGPWASASADALHGRAAVVGDGIMAPISRPASYGMPLRVTPLGRRRYAARPPWQASKVLTLICVSALATAQTMFNVETCYGLVHVHGDVTG
jgi:hypothetical protein